MKCKRKKAWIGAVISAAAGIANAAINSYKDKKQKELNTSNKLKQEGINQAANLTSQFNSTDYIDDYNNKFIAKNGGKYYDRIKFNRKFSCGGRHKTKH